MFLARWPWDTLGETAPDDKNKQFDLYLSNKKKVLTFNQMASFGNQI